MIVTVRKVFVRIAVNLRLKFSCENILRGLWIGLRRDTGTSGNCSAYFIVVGFVDADK